MKVKLKISFLWFLATLAGIEVVGQSNDNNTSDEVLYNGVIFSVIEKDDVEGEIRKINSRDAANPFQAIGKDAESFTLSEGRYNEFHLNKNLRKVGAKLINLKTGKIVAIAVADTMYSEATLEPEVQYRFPSIDPLAGKYPGVTPYAFGMNRPIDGIDQDGLEWVDADGNVLTESQLKVVKVYIFYSDHFDSQAQVAYDRAVAKYGAGAVAKSNLQTSSEFSSDWSNISGENVQSVQIFAHGKNQSFTTADGDGKQQLVSTGTGKTNISGTQAVNIQDLPQPTGDITNAELCLYTCNSNDTRVPAADGQGELTGTKETVAQAFRGTFDFKRVIGTKEKVNFHGTTYDKVVDWMLYNLTDLPPIFWAKYEGQPVPSNGEWDHLKRPKPETGGSSGTSTTTPESSGSGN